MRKGTDAIAQLAQDLRRARGDSFPFLVWSGSLPPARDEAEAVNRLLRRPWAIFTGTAALGEHWAPPHERIYLDEISEAQAISSLTWAIGHALAYENELMLDAEALEFAARFVGLLPADRRWFSNSATGFREWTPLTNYTFDTGVIAAAGDHAWIAWFTDED